MVLLEALAMVCAGLAAGRPLAFWAERLAGRWMADLPVGGTPTIAAAAAAMIPVALLAAYVPARRAAKADPMGALRCE